MEHHDHVHVHRENQEQRRAFPRDRELGHGEDEQDAKYKPDQDDYSGHAGQVGDRNLVLALVDVEQGIVPELPQSHPGGEDAGAGEQEEEAPRVLARDRDQLPAVPEHVEQVERIEDEPRRPGEDREHHGERVGDGSAGLMEDVVFEEPVEQDEAEEEQRGERRVPVRRPELREHERVEAGDDELEGHVFVLQAEGAIEPLEEGDHRQEEERRRHPGG